MQKNGPDAFLPQWGNKRDAIRQAPSRASEAARSNLTIAEGARFFAIAVRMQPKDRALTDAEIEAVAQKIVAAVSRATGGSLRT